MMAVLRESLSNVRHAQATDVEITVAAGPELILTVAGAPGCLQPGAPATAHVT